MGFVRVAVKLFAPANGHAPAEVDMLVGTRATYTVVPRSVLDELGVRPVFSRAFEKNEGRPIEREVGGVDIEVEGRRPPAPVPVVFGESDDGAVLGVTALESIGLKVNPVAGTLETVELRLWSIVPGGE